MYTHSDFNFANISIDGRSVGQVKNQLSLKDCSQRAYETEQEDLRNRMHPPEVPRDHS